MYMIQIVDYMYMMQIVDYMIDIWYTGLVHIFSCCLSVSRDVTQSVLCMLSQLDDAMQNQLY